MPKVVRTVYDEQENDLHGEYINSPDMDHAETVYEDMKPYWDDAEWWTWFDLPGHTMVVAILDDNGNIVESRVSEAPQDDGDENEE